MTRKDRILNKILWNRSTEMSCQEICDIIAEKEKITDKYAIRYLSGSVSSTLAKLVKEGVLEYSERKTSRSGHIYRKKQKPQS